MRERLINAMVASTTLRSLLRRLAIGFAAAIVGLAVHSSASASCGDYVYVRDAHGRLVHASELMGGSHPAATNPSGPAPAPCHGPRCSQMPSAPPAAPPAPIRWLSTHDGLLTVLHDGDHSLNGRHWPLPDVPAHPLHHPGRVFRPPRS